MPRFDITTTNAAVERLIETTTDPKHQYLLQVYNRHRYLEMAGRFEEIFAPEMTVPEPVYHFAMMGQALTLEGADAVKAVYRDWTETAQCVFYVEEERIAISDAVILSTSIMYQQVPGAVLAAGGVAVAPDSWYVVKSAEHMIWPYDDRGRLMGEDVWEYDESIREVIPLDPSEVLSVERSAELLAPLIKPVPEHNPFTA